jgi:hypothetical protein
MINNAWGKTGNEAGQNPSMKAKSTGLRDF